MQNEPNAGDSEQVRDLMRRERVYLDRQTFDLVLAVSKGSTILKYGWRHYCQQHKVFVDKKHMSRCSLL